VLGALGVERTVSTIALPIGGGREFPTTEDAAASWVGLHRDVLPAARAAQLLTRYGTRAATVIEAINETVDEPLVTDATYSRAEVAYLVSTEAVVHLIDVVLRRTNHAFTGDVSIELLLELAEIAGDTLGWDAARRADEVRETVEELAERHGIVLHQETHSPRS
jgi:glycerol-3-phosphate dehydrogenase